MTDEEWDALGAALRLGNGQALALMDPDIAELELVASEASLADPRSILALNVLLMLEGLGVNGI